MKLHPKIQELKRRAAPINYSSLSVNERGELNTTLLDQRIVEGYLIKWGQVNSFGEKVIKGACAKSLQERGPGSSSNYKITFLWQHKQDDPLALFAELKEDDYGLYFKTNPLDEVPSADRAIKQLRSGTLNQFSVGFNYVWDKIEYDETDDSLVLKEINLYEGSIVTIGADKGTYAIRSMEEIEDLHDEIEDFIDTLPRKVRLQARELFARQKSLINLEPPQQRAKALQESGEPAKTGINYDFLIKNFKL